MALQYNLAKVYEISENDTEFALQIVTLFLEEVPAEMKSIKTAIEEKDYTRTYAACHKIKPTLDLLSGLHFRLAYIMKNLSELDLEKTFVHPSDNSENKIKKIIGTYAWHGLHHLAHITELKKRKGW